MTDNNTQQVRWRLTGITTTGDNTYEATISDPAGQQKTYTFTAETVDVAGTPLLMIRCVQFDNDTLYDRASAKAVFDAVTSFHHAHHHDIDVRARDTTGT